MVRRFMAWGILAFFVISVAGCATCKKRDAETAGLKDKVQALEADNQVKDNEINNLRESLAKQAQESDSASLNNDVREVKARPTVKQIQAALKNAGYEPGAIDGKLGSKTRNAIREFQRAKGLNIDGKVGKATWSVLRKYLDSKS